MTNGALIDVAAALATGHPELDAASHRIWRNKEIIAPVLREIVPEYRNNSVEDICQCIDEASIKSTSGYVSDIPEKIEELNGEFKSELEKPLRFDIYFKAKKPKVSGEETNVFLHFDYEIQNEYKPSNPSYPLIKRAIYYLSRGLSAQLSVVTGQTNYSSLEKVYSIWLCLFGVPDKQKNTVSRYHLVKEDLLGAAHEPEEHYDLLECVLIRCGNREAKGNLFEYINALYSGDLETIKRYTDIGSKPEIEKGVKEMTYSQALIHYTREEALEEGKTRGRAEGKAEGKAEGIIEGWAGGRSEGEASKLVFLVENACSNPSLNWNPQMACEMLGESYENYLEAKKMLAKRECVKA